MSDAAKGLVLELNRTLSAPPDRVFKALTDPTELVVWWGPLGFTTPEITMDLRVGGRYRFGMQPPDGDLFYLVGEFLEIDPPSLLGFTFVWEDPDPDDRDTVVTLSLETSGRDLTVLSLSQVPFATEARLALHEGGWTDSFDRLSDHIGSAP